MKTRRLSEIDLARFACLPAGEQLEHALRLYNSGGGAWSYNPVRESTADILAARTLLLGEPPPVSWPKIARQIERACTKGEDQVEANVQVGKVLFDESRCLGWSAAKVHMGGLPIGIGESVRYWSDVVIEDGDGPFIPFFDHRRALGVANASIRQIVCSMQHLWIRERNPDLMDARLAVVRFPGDRGERGIHLNFHNDADLLSYEELDSRVRIVYETWARVSDERVRETRRSGSGGTTPFGF
jgi:hypothetical protein